MVVPHRGVPHVHVWSDKRIDNISARTAREAGSRKCSGVLLSAKRECHSRSLTRFLLEGEPWDSHGNKVRYHQEQSDDFSYPNRCPRDFYTPSRYAAACVYALAVPGSLTAKTSSCSSNQAAIQWLIFRLTMSLSIP